MTIDKISSYAGRDWGQEKKGTTEDEMAGWHHWLDGRESEWTPGVDDGQGGLVCCNSWGRKESDMTEQLNWTELNWIILLKTYTPAFLLIKYLCSIRAWAPMSFFLSFSLPFFFFFSLSLSLQLSLSLSYCRLRTTTIKGPQHVGKVVLFKIFDI